MGSRQIRSVTSGKGLALRTGCKGPALFYVIISVLCGYLTPLFYYGGG